MSDRSRFDESGCLRRYLEYVRDYPERFVNPPGDIYEILLDPERMAHARAEAVRRRRAEGMSTDDTRVGVLGEDPYLVTMRDAVRFADGSYGLYNRLMVPSGAAILPVLDDGRIVLLNRFRHGTRRWHLEAPRGSFNGGVPRVEEARRELREEIGADATEMVPLGQLHSTTGCLDEEHELFLARITTVGLPDRHEAIQSLETLPVSRVEALIADGTITDGPTLVLFLRGRLGGHL